MSYNSHAIFEFPTLLGLEANSQVPGGACCAILYFGHVASKRVFHTLQSNVKAQKINGDFSIVQREGGGRRAKAHSLMSNPLCPDP